MNPRKAEALHETVRACVGMGVPENLRGVLSEAHPADIAEAVRGLNAEELHAVFSILDPAQAAEVLARLPARTAAAVALAMDREAMADLLERMPDDDAADLLGDMAARDARDLLARMDPAEARDVTHLLQYPKDTAGGIMTREFLALPIHETVGRAKEILRSHPRYERFHVLYAVDREGRLRGVLPLRRLLFHPEGRAIGEVMDPEPVSVPVTMDQESVAQTVRKYDLLSVPVVDEEGRVVGQIDVDDILDVVHEEAAEDIGKLGGAEALRGPYFEVRFREMLRARGGWLVFLFLGEMLTATAMAYFEDEIARAVVLALFVPLIISSGGNSGSQASTLIVRSLALGEIRLRDFARVALREAAVGVSLGVLLGAIGFLRIVLWQAVRPIYGPHYLLVAMTVWLSLVGVVTWGTLAGAMLPFLFRRLGFDPASASAPFVATLVDVSGIVIYFSVAKLVLSGTLL